MIDDDVSRRRRRESEDSFDSDDSGSDTSYECNDKYCLGDCPKCMIWKRSMNRAILSAFEVSELYNTYPYIVNALASSAGACYSLVQITEGADNGGRTGDTVRLLRLSLRLYIRFQPTVSSPGPNTFPSQQARFILIQVPDVDWLPSPADVLATLSGSSGVSTTSPIDVRSTQRFRLLYDRVWTLVAMTPTQGVYTDFNYDWEPDDDDGVCVFNGPIPTNCTNNVYACILSDTSVMTDLLSFTFQTFFYYRQ